MLTTLYDNWDGRENSMTENRNQEYVTIIGMNYLMPISKILEMITKEPRLPPHDMASVYDNVHSVAVVILTVFMIESDSFKDYQYLDNLEELFFLRDAIAQNHLWSYNISWNDIGIMKVRDVKRIAGGDKKYYRVIDLNTNRTKHLKLRLRPTSVCFEEAFITLHETLKFFEYLETKNKLIITLDAIHIPYKGKVPNFRSFIREIPDLGEGSFPTGV